MLSLRDEKLRSTTIPINTGWLLGYCMEARGKQELWTKQKPELLTILRELAIIQSVESSNRIEGITVAVDRLKPLVLGRAKPLDRSEEEIAGYRRALDWIFTRKNPIMVRGTTIQHLHSLSQGGFSGDAGEWKQHNNEIIELLPNGERMIRFTPASAAETPKLIKSLCENYNSVCGIEAFPSLLVIATFIFDFLCIHPFRDGNGRVSRLLTTLLLQLSGFEVGRYISLERLIEDRKTEYYDVLFTCSQGWHEGLNEMLPWWNFMLSIFRQAYQEFERKVTDLDSRIAKSDIIKHVIHSKVEEFSLADIAVELPMVSTQLIKKVLSDLKEEGKIQLSGKGRAARWIILDT